jgi:DNA-binding transcriptional LysR family regulator
MALDTNDLLIFAQVADAGSFSAAAERSGQPKSTLSRRIAALEAQLGERLFTRSTRRLSMTEFGSGILEHARRLQDEAEAVAAYAQYRQAVPRGRLRVTLPSDFAEWILGPLILQFSAAYPEVKLELDLSSRRVDLIGEQFDLAIRMANRLPDDATLVARRLFDLHNGLYASPAYLAHFGTPTTPEDLHQHKALQLVGGTGETQRWQLTRLATKARHDKESWEGLPEGPLAANSIALLRLLATHGLGIAGLSERYAADLLAEGRLVRVLPDWHLPSVTAWAVMPGRRLIPARTRAFLDVVQTALAA